ncbi:MAG: TonB-dependent receptor, partial [Catalinimonas sp.]
MVLRVLSCLLLLLPLLTAPLRAQRQVRYGQRAAVAGRITDGADEQPLPGVLVLTHDGRRQVMTDAEGRYELILPPGTHELHAFVHGYAPQIRQVTTAAGERQVWNPVLRVLADSLAEVLVEGRRPEALGVGRLMAVEGTAIYEAKKTEVIKVRDMAANLATNQARQVFAKVPGLNIWESDAAGLQLGIGARGLNPNRTSNFNVRQNGYDISADALGYPESYYTPPMQAIERVEVVRGAASLQYGTQFGGLLNFVLKEGPDDRKLQVGVEQTLGAFGLRNTFVDAGGTVGSVNYYGYGQYKRGDGWQPNSEFEQRGGYGSVRWVLGPRLQLRGEFTHMYYRARQPGGLTDALFRQNARQSRRPRNWFEVDWNLAALHADYRFSDRTKLNVRTFGLWSGRASLGNLNNINQDDVPGTPRTLIRDAYRNLGGEARLLHRYRLFGQPAVGLVGGRVYRGFTRKQQGDAPVSDRPDFRFLRPDDLEVSDYDFPSRNVSLFTEHVWQLTPRLSVTPGLRAEYIRTMSQGYYRNRVRDRAGNLVVDEPRFEETNVGRAFAFGGLGVSYRPRTDLELYANASQNYRSVTFSDLRVDNPNFRLDSSIVDEHGYNLDLGTRGERAGILNWDVSLFYLRYADRIGFVTVQDEVLFVDQRFKTNVGDSRHVGVEAFGEVDVWRALRGRKRPLSWTLFVNLSLTDARYVRSDRPGVRGKRVELAPPLMVRAGSTLRQGGFSLTGQYAHVARHYTDATNTDFVANAVAGAIPTYGVADLSARYAYRRLHLSTGLNNVLDARYFTRRAESYPGPGIIPAA